MSVAEMLNYLSQRHDQQKCQKRREISSFFRIGPKHASQQKDIKEAETTHTTPEQLLQMLDAQLAARRSQRAKTDRNRATVLAVGILFIVVSAGAALLVLNQMLLDLRQGDRLPASAPVQIRGK